MFKKGFLNKKSAKATGSAVGASTAGQEPRGSQQTARTASDDAALPTELIIQVVEERLAERDPRLQADIASLRLVSKLLHKIVSPHFYETIQLSCAPHGLALARRLQDQPKICETTRNIYWDEARSNVPIHVSKPWLVRFPNVNDVAWWCHFKPDGEHLPYAMGWHYALRDAGDWCSPLPFLRDESHMATYQCTPTLTIVGQPFEPDMEEYTRTEQLEADFFDQHGYQAPRASPWALERQPKRAVWAAHLVVPILHINTVQLLPRPRTITHLTITFYVLPDVTDSPAFPAQLEMLLHRRNMPLLEHLVLRLIDFGPQPKGTPTRKQADPYFYRDSEADMPAEGYDAASIKRREKQLWEARETQIRVIVANCHDPRVRFETIDNAGATRSHAIFENVRSHLIQGWQDRVFYDRAGPWTDPLTKKVRPELAAEYGDPEEEEQEEDIGLPPW